MKKTNITTKFLLLLLLAMVTKARAQGYQSYFGADSTRLNVYESCVDNDYTFYLTIDSADTVNINGHDYLRGTPQYGFYFGVEFYFREDTVTGRLYRYIPMLDGEILLSDMSMTVGDTISFSDSSGIHLAVVESISFENGRKVIHFTINYAYYYHMEFYEGIFPSIIPLGLVNDYSCYSYLLCEYKDGEKVFENPRFNTCYFDSGWSVQETLQQQVLVYPTKVRSPETINIESTEPILEVSLLDLYGRAITVVCNEETPCHWNMPIPNGASGIYIVKITTEKGLCYEKIQISN
jgi:hypothetical protein